jgi:hypothetical protein
LLANGANCLKNRKGQKPVQLTNKASISALFNTEAEQQAKSEAVAMKAT